MTQTINSKPAAGLFGAYLATLTVGALSRYTSYDPNPEEVGAIVGIFGFAVAWLVPERLWRRSEPTTQEPSA